MKYVIEDTILTDIADSIRSKTGSTEGIKPTDMANAIDNITGGGSAEGFATVTFMNGSEEIYYRPVYIGDDCPDPVTQGRIEAPTKESTVDKVFSYNGWALADGEAADSSVLKNITEDKTLYAAYASSARKYTITYYDDDGTTVLHTEQVAYGTVPSYVPEKEGFGFVKWTPTPEAVTGDAAYTASWISQIASGTCGDNVYWVLDPQYNLIISGTGAINDYGILDLKPWSDYKELINSVVIENGVTNIGDGAFSGCTSLTSVRLPDSVTSIGKNAFRSCTSLTSITIPDSVTSIGNSAFYACEKLESITIPNSVTSIGNNAFYGCKSLESITIPDSVTTIGEGVFSYCEKLSSFTIPNSVTSIGKSAFFQCYKLTSITIPDSITSIGYGAFGNCPLTSAIFEDTEGWVVDDTAISSSDLANPSTAAKYLKETYRYKTWTNS